MAFLLLMWFVNFAISWFNAWGCGKSWNETKHLGGVIHFMNYMGAIMSASGFTWCYLIVLAFAGAYIPLEQDDGTIATILEPAMFEAFLNLGYLVIIVPILGSGLALTVQSWSHFWRRRTFGDGAVAGWNTYAMTRNAMYAADMIPDAVGGLGSFFSGSDSDDGKGLIVIFLVLAAIFGGVLTTYFIIKNVAESTAFTRSVAPTRF